MAVKIIGKFLTSSASFRFAASLRQFRTPTLPLQERLLFDVFFFYLFICFFYLLQMSMGSFPVYLSANDSIASTGLFTERRSICRNYFQSLISDSFRAQQGAAESNANLSCNAAHNSFEFGVQRHLSRYKSLRTKHMGALHTSMAGNTLQKPSLERLEGFFFQRALSPFGKTKNVFGCV